MGYIEEIREKVGEMPIILNSAGVIITDARGRVLLCYRMDTKDWGLPGGYMELGETFKETAMRELQEEMSITIKNLTLFDVFSGSEFYHEYPNGDKVYSVIVIYLASEYGGKITADNKEINEVSFFNLKLLPEVTTTTKNVLEAYKNSITT